LQDGDGKMNDIWNEAPEGATHYTPANETECLNAVYWRVIEGVFVKAWAVLGNGSLSECKSGCEFDLTRPDAVTRPWASSGLPPVGVECEALWSSTPNEVWLPAKVLAHDEGMVVFRWKAGERKGEYSNYSQTYNFRPIRTPEQIPAEEREKAIEALAVELAGHWSSEAVSLQRETAAYLHDIGYRRVEQ